MSTNDPKRWKYEAQIGFRPTFASILGQYQRAVDILFSQIEEGGSPVNVISYPLLFLVRHSLELGYKLNINYLSQYSQLPDKVNWNKHLLLELHDAFGRHFNAVVEKLEVDKAIADEFNSRYTEVKKLTQTFAAVDRDSFSFRYPVDTKQKAVLGHEQTINLLDVKEVYDKAMVLFFHTANVLSHATDYVDYMDQLMEEELRKGLS